jgi:hypothetical protein
LFKFFSSELSGTYLHEVGLVWMMEKTALINSGAVIGRRFTKPIFQISNSLFSWTQKKLFYHYKKHKPYKLNHKCFDHLINSDKCKTTTCL